MNTSWSTSASAAASTTLRVPTTLVRIASTGCASSSGTCLRAAEWKTTSGRTDSNTLNMRSRSRMSASVSCGAGVGTEPGRGVVQVGLVVVEQHQPGRLELGDLGGDLGADRAAGAGDERPADR